MTRDLPTATDATETEERKVNDYSHIAKIKKRLREIWDELQELKAKLK